MSEKIGDEAAIRFVGHIKVELTLTNRTYPCKRCGMISDRDLNAAINLNTVGRAHPEPADACGLDGSDSSASTDESTSQDEARSESVDNDMCLRFAEQEIC